MTDHTDWPTTCPFCGQRHDAVSIAVGHGRTVPEKGDATMCFTCGSFCIFDATGSLRKPTKAEQRVLDADDRIKEARAAWLQIKDQIPSRRRR